MERHHPDKPAKRGRPPAADGEARRLKNFRLPVTLCDDLERTRRAARVTATKIVERSLRKELDRMKGGRHGA